MRDVRYEDLLRRSETQLDIRGIEGYLKDKVVLVSGAGGSIGSELCRQILRFEPRLLILYDAGEENLYALPFVGPFTPVIRPNSDCVITSSYLPYPYSGLLSISNNL